MRLLFSALSLVAMLTAPAGASIASPLVPVADGRPINVPHDRNCSIKCQKTTRICLAGGNAAKECKRINDACTRACTRR